MMAEDQTLNKVNLLGGTISIWLKVTGTVIAIIGYGFLTYYQIQNNTAEMHEFKLVVNKEFEVWSGRSDKRYKRALAEAEELKNAYLSLENELEETKLELAFIKGRIFEQDKN